MLWLTRKQRSRPTHYFKVDEVKAEALVDNFDDLPKEVEPWTLHEEWPL